MGQRFSTTGRGRLGLAQALALACAGLAALPAQAQNDERRNQLSLQVGQGLMHDDRRRLLDVEYSRRIGERWQLGGAVGLGKLVHDPGDAGGLYLAGHLRYRFDAVPALGDARPRLGVETGVATYILNYGASYGAVCAGLQWPAGERRGWALDLLLGHANFDKALTTTGTRASSKLAMLRFGHAWQF